MQDIFKQSLGLMVLRGVAAILFGILAFMMPRNALAALLALFGAFALIYGLFTVIAAIRLPAGMSGKGTFLALGVLSILAGAFTFLYPGLTALSLLFLIAAWALITGIEEIIFAIRLRSVLPNQWLLILGGALSVVFGVFLFVHPGAGALSVMWLIGAYALVYGATLLVASYRLKSLTGEVRAALS